jgi:hypothetical protein
MHPRFRPASSGAISFNYNYGSIDGRGYSKDGFGYFPFQLLQQLALAPYLCWAWVLPSV